MNHQKCKIKTKIIDINNNEPLFYPYSIDVNKCSDSCNDINDPYPKLCVQELMKQDIQNVTNLANRNGDQVQVFVIKNKGGIMKNVDVNAKN